MGTTVQREFVPSPLRVVDEGDDGVYVIAVGETDDPESWSLAFMECSEEDMEDQQELDLGGDSYCLVVDPGQATHYGGVVECEVTETRLRLKLTPEAARDLGVSADVTFALELTSDQLRMLKDGLTRVFASGRENARPTLLHT
ncbi:Imm10 family immunity protein [Micromonospora purpureochromogenes]|uniref:Imm10 family immunity protein n=1 Tax=Micromonospora purpureochromogenes TaxID=47872 RepID=UPI0033C6AC8A